MVEHKPGRRVLMIGVLSLLGLGCLALGYAFGNNEAKVSRFTNADLSRDLQVMHERVARLEVQLVDAELNEQVQQQAADTLRQDLAAMRDQTRDLQEEVTFYKSLMAPGSLARGLQISELDVAPTEEQRAFRFELLLTQVAQRRRFIAGDLRVDVVGRWLEGVNPGGQPTQAESDTSAEGQQVLSLTELADMAKYPLKFRFRYFQNFDGLLRVPENFVPDSVLVTAQQSGKDAIQASFPWPAGNKRGDESLKSGSAG